MNDIVIYTAQEVADLLKVSLSEAYTLIRRGDLRAVRIGRSVRVLHNDLVEFIQRNRLSPFTSGGSLLVNTAVTEQLSQPDIPNGLVYWKKG